MIEKKQEAVDGAWSQWSEPRINLIYLLPDNIQ
jgi:hypothetical protein